MTAVYDDRDYCGECGAIHALPRNPGKSPETGFLGWMRGERYPTFLVKISAVSGVEVVLTALWLRALLLGPADLLSGMAVLV